MQFSIKFDRNFDRWI